MGKEKGKKKVARPTGRFKEFWMSTRGRKLRGAVYVLLALFLAVATVSFFISWPSHDNWLGRVGYHLSALVVQKTFGIASLGLSFLLFIYGLRLWKVELLPWKKTLWSVLFWMVWVSTLVAYFVGVFGKLPFQLLVLLCTLLATVGAMM